MKQAFCRRHCPCQKLKCVKSYFVSAHPWDQRTWSRSQGLNDTKQVMKGVGHLFPSLVWGEAHRLRLWTSWYYVEIKPFIIIKHMNTAESVDFQGYFSHRAFYILSSRLAMNLSEQISFLFSCNVSPSETPQLHISVTKSEPLTIAVPMTIFYSVVFLFGVWTSNS